MGKVKLHIDNLSLSNIFLFLIILAIYFKEKLNMIQTGTKRVTSIE